MNLSVTSINHAAVAPHEPRPDVGIHGHSYQTSGKLFTLRGGLLIALGLFLVFGPAPQDYDIIASILGFSLLSLLWLLVLFNVAFGNALLRNISVDLLSSEALASEIDSALRSKEAIRFTIRTSPLRIPTFFVLKLSLEFESETIATSIHLLTGSTSTRRIVQDEVVFPHRGNWILSGVSLKFGDQFGFAQPRIRIVMPPSFRSITIKPPLGFTGQLPILSSSHRAGDDVAASSEHQGDPFDLKPYHPSDGIKKILWKVYARTGELISRQPERSMTPEGQVIIYVMARPNEDYVCSSTLAYIRSLIELDLEVVAGCEGMAERPLGRNIEDSEELLVDSTFESLQSTPQSRINDISRLTSEVNKIFPGISLDRILIFLGRDRFVQHSDVLEITGLGQQLQSHGITPVFFVAQDQTAVRRKRASSRLLSWLVTLDKTPALPSSNVYAEFASVCAKNSWDVILA